MKYSPGLKLVMLIDDSEIDTIINTKIMETELFATQMIAFNSAKSALKYLNDNANQIDQLPDLIFLDINMPVVNGFDFLEEFDSFSHTIKNKCSIVMLSSSLNSTDKHKALSYSYVIKFISKPLKTEKLIELKRAFIAISSCEGPKDS